MTTPERSHAQRMDALVRANEIRTYRAELKRELKAGRADVGAILLRPDARVETMKVYDLLLAVPKLGRAKVHRALARVRMAPSKTVGGMSRRQRDELLEELTGYRPARRDAARFTRPAAIRNPR